MTRYIDASEFRKRIDHYPPDIRDTAKKELRYTPTADVVEVVRCKECKYRDPEDKKCDCGHFIRWQLPRQDDWFCADGERREDA